MFPFVAVTHACRRRHSPRHGLRRRMTAGALLAALILAHVASTQPTLAQASDRPNIVFILADDLGYGDINCFGQDRCQVDTPAFDRLAREGMRFTDAHAIVSFCVPTRMAVMTGRYPWRFGASGPGGPWGFLGTQLPEGQPTLGTTLKRGGYRTGYIGKWHLGTRMQTTDGKPQGPNNVDYGKPLKIGPPQFGFDDSFILPGSLDMFPYAFVRNNEWVGEVTAQKGWSAFNRVGPAAEDFEDHKVLDTLSGEAERFIGENAEAAKQGRPFFLYFALTSPHTPTCPSEAFIGSSDIGLYGDFVQETDHCVGRVLAALDKHELAGDTLVIATSDHGPALYAGPIRKATANQNREMEKQGHYSAGGFRGYKFSIYEGGLRVPFVARWPGVVSPGAACDRLVGLQDMMATFADVSNVKLPSDQAPDSIKLTPLLKDADAAPPRTSMMLRSTMAMAIRQGKWKLALCPGSGCNGRYGQPSSESAWREAVKSFGRRVSSKDELYQAPLVQLFDLDADPTESKNLAASHPERVQQMASLMKEQIESGRSTKGPKLSNDRENIERFFRVPPFVWKK